MTWLILATVTAFFEAFKDVFSKQSLKVLDEYVVAVASQGFTVLFLLPALLITGIPTLGKDFWMALLIGGSLNVVSFTLYIKAIKQTDLSLAVPLVTLTPLFLLVTSPLIVQEVPTFTDAIGVFLIVVGSYVLNSRTRDRGYFAPFRAMVQDRGCRMMIMVAMIWSVTSAFDKVGVQNSSPLFWSIALFSYIALGTLPLMLWRSRGHISKARRSWRGLATIGMMFAISVGSQMVAIGMAPVTQVIAIKRMSALISVIFGHFLFREQGLKERLFGASIMVSGVAIMTIF